MQVLVLLLGLILIQLNSDLLFNILFYNEQDDKNHE